MPSSTPVGFFCFWFGFLFVCMFGFLCVFVSLADLELLRFSVFKVLNYGYTFYFTQHPVSLMGCKNPTFTALRGAPELSCGGIRL